MGKKNKKLTRKDKIDMALTENKCWKCGNTLIKNNGVIRCTNGCFHSH